MTEKPVSDIELLYACHERRDVLVDTFHLLRMLLRRLLKGIHKLLVRKQTRRQVVLLESVLTSVLLAIFVFTEPVDLIVMFHIINMKHHFLDLIVDDLVDLHHSSTRLLLVTLIIWLQRNRLAELDEHFCPRMEIVRVVVA